MSEALKLTGTQRKILREGIICAYPNPDDLKILLSEQMDVQLGAIARGDAYKNKVFALIQDFEADGTIKEFIRVVVNDKPKSPYLIAVKNEFASIDKIDFSSESIKTSPKKILILAANPVTTERLRVDEEVREIIRMVEVSKPLSDDQSISNDLLPYIERPPIEQRCRQEILGRGALIRLKAPQKMGKTLLMNHIFDFASGQSYRMVRLDIEALETSYRYDAEKLLRWLCQRVSKRLKIEDRTEDYWGNQTPNTNCTDYFEEYLLDKLDVPLILGLDNIDCFFSHECKQVAADFFALLRYWHNLGKESNSPWGNLKLILVYATEDLPKLKVFQSPFNVGEEILLPEFKGGQVAALARSYGLEWTTEQVGQLMEWIGGHPFLVHKTIMRLKDYPDESLREILEKAPTEEGIYSHHLQHHWGILEADQELAQILKKVVVDSSSLAITPKDMYKLESMGLIRKEGNAVKPRCQLYRYYFRERLKSL